jgi:esterase
VGAFATLRRVPVKKTVPLHYRVMGEGPPLLVLHGLLGSHHNLLPVAAKLATQFHVFAVDHRNHAASPHADAFNYDLMAADLGAFLAEHQLGRVSLLGHSMGGKVAMRFAQLHPEAVARLIVADMSPRAYPLLHAELLEVMAALDLKRCRHRREIEQALEAVAPEKSTRQFLLKSVGPDPAGGFRWKSNVRGIRDSYPGLSAALPASPAFPGPALFIRGECSDYIRDEDSGLIRQLFPQAILRTIPQAGHWVHADAPDEFGALCLDFLSGNK